MANGTHAYAHDMGGAPLTNAAACAEGDAYYFLNAYSGWDVGECDRLPLGHELPEDPTALMDYANEAVRARPAPRYNRYAAAGLLVVRFCLNNHPDGTLPEFQGARMEIGQAIVPAAPDAPRIQGVPDHFTGETPYTWARTKRDSSLFAGNPLMLPRAAGAPQPSELIKVAQPHLNSFVYVGLNGTEALIPPATL